MDQVSSTTLFVGSLSSATNEADLKSYFSMFGRVIRAKVIVDLETLRSKQCALIFCDSPSTCQRILRHPCHCIDGRIVRVDLAEEERKGTKCCINNSIFVGNIDPRTDKAGLSNYFKQYGDLAGVKMFTVSTDSITLNAIISFKEHVSIEMIFNQLYNHYLDGHQLKISRYKPKAKDQQNSKEALSVYFDNAYEHNNLQESAINDEYYRDYYLYENGNNGERLYGQTGYNYGNQSTEPLVRSDPMDLMPESHQPFDHTYNVQNDQSYTDQNLPLLDKSQGTKSTERVSTCPINNSTSDSSFVKDELSDSSWSSHQASMPAYVFPIELMSDNLFRVFCH